MTIETVRLTARARNQLVTLKRRTGIDNWNVICRWAFCVSIAEPHPPRAGTADGEPGVEMTWRTFGGEYADIYLGLLKQRCLADGLPTDHDSLVESLKLHIHRGIGYLANRSGPQNIEELVGLVVHEVG